MTTFNIARPTYTKKQWIEFILFRMIFPPILVWDLLKIITNKLFGGLLGRIILPAQNLPKQNLDNLHIEGVKYNVIKVKTHDGAILDTIELLTDKQSQLDINNKKYIINMCGNNGCYENKTAEMERDAANLQCNIIGFNYRGVQNSTGKTTSKDDLVTDSIAQVQRLLDQGVPSRNIALKGYSLGAAVASLVANHFHQQGKPIYIFNDRSFSSLTNTIVGWVRAGKNLHNSGHLETTTGIILGTILKPLIKLVLAMNKWEISAADAFKEIPPPYRQYMTVRTERENRTDKTPDDAMITHYASMHLALKAERRAKKTLIKNRISMISGLNINSDQLSQMINGNINNLSRELEKMKQNKMHAIKTTSDAHNEPADNLQNISGVRGHMFFYNFVNETLNQHHSPKY